MLTREFACRGAGVLVTAVLALAPPVASAQSDETGVGEVSALGGLALGAGARPALTGSSGVAMSRYAIAMFDTSFLTLGQHSIQTLPDRSKIDRSYLFDFGVDFHIRIPVNSRWAPYGILGAGLLWNRVRLATVNALGVSGFVHDDQFNAALHTGAGVRYYMGENWGIRPEVKVIVSKHVYTQILMGVFYVLPPNWP